MVHGVLTSSDSIEINFSTSRKMRESAAFDFSTTVKEIKIPRE